MFGAAIGAGEQALGAGALKAGRFYSEVAADEATNNYMEGARKLMYGDPDKPWIGPDGNPILDNDGKPQPDRGLFGLQGDQAMRAAPQAVKQLDDLRKRLGAGLLTGDSMLKFDAETRRMQSYHNTEIGRHSENESQKWAGEVEAASINNAKIAIGQATARGDLGEVARLEKDLIGAHVRRASRLGGGDALISQANTQGQIESAEAQIRAAPDYATKQSLYEKYKPLIAGAPNFEAVTGHIRVEGEREDREYNKAFEHAFATDPSTPYNPPSGRKGTGGTVGKVIDYAPSTNILTGTGLSTEQYNTFRGHLAARESGSYAEPPNKGGYMGRYQMGKDEIEDAAKRMGIPVPTQQQFLSDPQLQERMFENYTLDHHNELMGTPRYANASATEKAAILAGAHLGGVTGVKSYLATGRDPADSNGTHISSYVNSMTQALGGAAPSPVPTTAATSGAAQGAIPIPSGTQSTAVATARPDLAAKVNQIEGRKDIPEDIKNKLIADAHRRDAQWRLANASNMRQLHSDITNNAAMLEAGKDVPLIPEDRIKAFAPDADHADDWIQLQQDAQQLGQAVNNAKTMSIPELGAKMAELNAATGVPGIHDFAHRQKVAHQFGMAAKRIIDGMSQDPVDFLAGNNETIIADQEALRALHGQATTPEGAQAYQAANTKYINDLLAAQEHFGLPNSKWHVLSQTEAEGNAAGITANPDQAPAKMRQMAAQYGQAWPQVWRDLGTIGKLPANYQMVGSLENQQDAAKLARALGQANKEGNNRALEALIDKSAIGSTRASAVIKKAITESPEINSYIHSMVQSGASYGMAHQTVDSIELLAQAKVAYDQMAPNEAAEQAIASAIGTFEFMPNGGARVPRARFDAVAQNARQTLNDLSLDRVQPPPVYEQPQAAGRATAADWLGELRGSPNWVTMGQAIRLMDKEGHWVKNRDNSFVEVPFDRAAPAVPPKAHYGPDRVGALP